MKVLDVVDQDKSHLGCIYKAMHRAKEVIASFYSHEERRYRPICGIIDRKWSNQLHKPLVFL